MDWWIFVLIAAAVLAVLVLAVSYICYLIAFHVREKDKIEDEFTLPKGREYEPYHARMLELMKLNKQSEYEAAEITSFDGLKLRGKLYLHSADAPLEIMFHGYRSTVERDLCGGLRRGLVLGRNVLVVYQRACGKSEGNVISFGANERYDCLSWIDYALRRLGPDTKIILSGISMGASTVLMAGGLELPDNVIAIYSDCAYTSAEDIIKKVISYMKLPPSLAYPFVRLGGLIFGHFDPNKANATEAMKKCRVPVLFLHGDADDFVPCEMSRINYEACASFKKLVTIPEAGHGLSFMKDKEACYAAIREFEEAISEIE